MYKIIATDAFVALLEDLPIKHVALLTQSFVSIEKINEEECSTLQENVFIIDLLEQIKNQELE